MAKIQMKDMVVLLPGIMGSVLQNKDGKDIWNLSLQAALRATGEILSRGSLLEELTLTQEDDPDRDYLDDIRATGLIQDARLVPGFFKIDGYSYIRRKLTEDFDVTPDRPDEDRLPNFFEFAYDWRRNNKVAARLLKKLIDEKLPIWKQRNPGAKVILIAHSMGGLVSRYYLEHLGGWKNCKALITLGTPYRGSVKILSFLANGYQKKPLPALTDVLRSFTSVYQLLPMYPVVNVNEKWQRVREIDGIPGVVKERAIQEYEFQKLINLGGNVRSYEFKPIIGVGQKSTFQSAILSDGRLEVSNDKLPLNPTTQEPLNAGYATGDDTVPLLSAIPVYLSDKLQEVPLVESHGALQSNVQVWNLLKSYLMRLQNTIQDFQNPQTIQSTAQTAGISLDVDDLYLPDEKVRLGAEIINVESEILKKVENFGGLSARINPVSGNEAKPIKKKFEQQGDSRYVLNLEPNVLAPGLYSLEVETSKFDKIAPKAVHDLFQVMG